VVIPFPPAVNNWSSITELRLSPLWDLLTVPSWVSRWGRYPTAGLSSERRRLLPVARARVPNPRPQSEAPPSSRKDRLVGPEQGPCFSTCGITSHPVRTLPSSARIKRGPHQRTPSNALEGRIWKSHRCEAPEGRPCTVREDLYSLRISSGLGSAFNP